MRSARCKGFPLAALALAAGCGGGAPGLTALAPSATLAAVSQDQSQLAFYTGATMLSTGAPMGSLSVEALPGGTPLKLADAAFAATFNRRGDVLLFATGQAASTDQGSNETYGALHLWRPGMTAAATLTSGYAILQAEPPDGSFALVWDGAKPTRAQAGSLLLVRASDCAGSACKPIALATNVVVHAVAASEDGRFAGYILRRGNTMTGVRFETWLVSVADGRASMLGSTSSLLSLAPLALSPDGALIAYAVETGVAPLQLQVASTATLAPVPWSTPPAMTGAIAAQFSDGATLIVHASSARGSEGLFRTAAAPARAIRLAAPPVKSFFVPFSPAGANRFLFVQNTDANGVGDLDLYDLLAAAPAPISLAKAAASFATYRDQLPVLSDKLDAVRLVDQFDPSSASGTLVVATLPAGGETRIATSDSLAASAFEPATDDLLYIDQPDATGAGLLTQWSAGQTKAIAGGVLNFRVRAPAGAAPGTLYLTISEPDPSSSQGAGIYSAPLP